MTIPNTTYRILVEKLGDSNAAQFIGNEGEVFYDPNNPVLRLSNGTTVGGIAIGGTAGGGNDSRISSTQISNWDTAYGWGNHSTAGYLTSFTETDPVFSASPVSGITSTKISNWDTAYGWGNHSVVGYQTATSTSYAQTLIVDPNGNDVSGNGGPNAPFRTVQKAHDYAEDNIPVSQHVIVKMNTGVYTENISVTRPNIHFVGLVGGVSKSTRISGNVSVGIATSVSGPADTMISFENLLIATSSGSSVMDISGDIGCSVTLKDTYLFTSSSTAKCLVANNTANTGIKVELENVVLQNQLSSGITLDLSNTYFANIDQMTVYGGTGTSMNIRTTDAVVYNSRFENVGVSTVINAISSFTSGKPSLVLGNSTLANPNANGNGIDIASGSTVNVGQVAFNVGTSAGTGFAVKGVLGSVFIHANNLIVPQTNNKVSSAIGPGNVPMATSLTPA